MNRIKAFSRGPFGSALLGGLVVALLGWAALAAGWVESSGNDGSPSAQSLPPLTEAVADDGGRGLSVNEIYDRASSGVAFIRASGRPQEIPVGPFGGPLPEQTATGSGLVIDDQGRVLTNAHVVDGATELEVTLGDDDQSHSAELVGMDDSTDVAVIDVDVPAEALEPLALGDSSAVDVGDPVVAIGNPFGLDRTATAGIVSALQREIPAPNGFAIRDVIQTDAAINPGNSGGPLLDASGLVVGINSQIESPAGGNVGIGFAVPIDTAREVAQQLISSGEVQHAFLGISAADLTPELAGVLNLGDAEGALVQSVVPGSPADEAGLQAGDATVSSAGQRVRVGGDLIVEIDGEAVEGMDDVITAVDAKQPGDEVELKLTRDGEDRTVTVQLADRPANASG